MSTKTKSANYLITDGHCKKHNVYNVSDRVKSVSDIVSKFVLIGATRLQANVGALLNFILLLRPCLQYFGHFERLEGGTDGLYAMKPYLWKIHHYEYY